MECSSPSTVRKTLEHRHEFVRCITVHPTKLKKILEPCDDGAPLGCAHDDDGPSSSQLEQALVPKESKCAKNGVGVDAEHSGKVLRLGDALARTSFTLSDRPSDRSGDLLVEIGGVSAVDLGESEAGPGALVLWFARHHDAIESSISNDAGACGVTIRGRRGTGR